MSRLKARLDQNASYWTEGILWYYGQRMQGLVLGVAEHSPQVIRLGNLCLYQVAHLIRSGYTVNKKTRWSEQLQTKEQN